MYRVGRRQWGGHVPGCGCRRRADGGIEPCRTAKSKHDQIGLWLQDDDGLANEIGRWIPYAAEGLTEQQLRALPPAQRAAIAEARRKITAFIRARQALGDKIDRGEAFLDVHLSEAGITPLGRPSR